MWRTGLNVQQRTHSVIIVDKKATMKGMHTEQRESKWSKGDKHSKHVDKSIKDKCSKHNRKSYGKDKFKESYKRKLHSIEQWQSSNSPEMSESSEESSSSNRPHRPHHSQSHLLPYEIGSIYYTDDRDSENKNTEQIFTDLVDDKGIKFTVSVDTGTQVNVLPRCIFEKLEGNIFQLKQSKATLGNTVEPILVMQELPNLIGKQFTVGLDLWKCCLHHETRENTHSRTQTFDAVQAFKIAEWCLYKWNWFKRIPFTDGCNWHSGCSVQDTRP